MILDDYQIMLNAYEEAGGRPSVFKDLRIAHLVVHREKVLASHSVEGLILNAKGTDSGVDIDMSVEEGIKIAHPVHLCFGVLPKEGRQQIKINALIKKGGQIKILAHCVFPNALRVQHIMDAKIVLEDNAVFCYDEVHYHGLTGGVEVVPTAEIKIGKGARLSTNFALTKGRVGRLKIDYRAEVERYGVLEMVTRVYGYGDDKVKVRESARLIGEGARGLIKSRMAIREEAQSEVVSELTACAPNTRGHIDCTEIVQGNAKAKAIPLVDVLHEKAQVTHEAAIGRVNEKQLETLMAHGLTEEEATYVIIEGMLK